MKERPILFSGPMVRAILDGRKTMTRRIARLNAAGRVKLPGKPTNWHCADPDASKACPYGQPGDRLWVRETWAKRSDCEDGSDKAKHYLLYRADYDSDDLSAEWHCYDRWRPSIHMPRWASRITLEVTSVRVERLQDISEDDAEAEGGFAGYHTPKNPERGPSGGIMQVRRFATLWDHINADRAPWSSNPWVWVVSFTPTPRGGT